MDKWLLPDFATQYSKTIETKQVSAAASRSLCCPQRWTRSAINWWQLLVEQTTILGKRVDASCQNSHTNTHPFNGPLSGTIRVSRYQKGKTNLEFTEARDSEWQWHQLGHMQVCTSLQTDNHASTPPLSFFRPDALPAAQPTASKHWRQLKMADNINGGSMGRYGVGWSEGTALTCWNSPMNVDRQTIGVIN